MDNSPTRRPAALVNIRLSSAPTQAPQERPTCVPQFRYPEGEMQRPRDVPLDLIVPVRVRTDVPGPARGFEAADAVVLGWIDDQSSIDQLAMRAQMPVEEVVERLLKLAADNVVILGVSEEEQLPARPTTQTRVILPPAHLREVG